LRNPGKTFQLISSFFVDCRCWVLIPRFPNFPCGLPVPHQLLSDADIQQASFDNVSHPVTASLLPITHWQSAYSSVCSKS
jgi:hypothetical protein